MVLYWNCFCNSCKLYQTVSPLNCTPQQSSWKYTKAWVWKRLQHTITSSNNIFSTQQTWPPYPHQPLQAHFLRPPHRVGKGSYSFTIQDGSSKGENLVFKANNEPWTEGCLHLKGHGRGLEWALQRKGTTRERMVAPSSGCLPPKTLPQAHPRGPKRRKTAISVMLSSPLTTWPLPSPVLQQPRRKSFRPKDGQGVKQSFFSSSWSRVGPNHHPDNFNPSPPHKPPLCTRKLPLPLRMGGSLCESDKSSLDWGHACRWLVWQLCLPARRAGTIFVRGQGRGHQAGVRPISAADPWHSEPKGPPRRHHTRSPRDACSILLGFCSCHCGICVGGRCMWDGKILQEKRLQRELVDWLLRRERKEEQLETMFVHTCASLIASGFNN